MAVGRRTVQKKAADRSIGPGRTVGLTKATDANRGARGQFPHTNLTPPTPRDTVANGSQLPGTAVTTPVELIVGPARSGKAGRVLAAYRRALAGAAPGRALMLVPTGLRRRRTQSLLLAAAETGVLLAPNILTLPEVAERLLTAAGRTVRRIHGLARRQVIRNCLDALDEKAAAPLGEVRTAPGLVDALDALFRELKAARVEPDAFARALAGTLRTPRNRLLALLYTAYQRRLQDLDVYDDQGRFWHAAALLADGEFGPFADLDLLAVDGFQHFDPAQLDVIQALSQRARRTLITLTWDPARPDLFAVTGRTREHLRDRFGDRLTETVSAEPAGLPADLERIRTRLFLAPGEEGDAARRPPAEGQLCVVRAAGRTREVEEVARRAVDLVRDGATEPASIAVIARSLETYAPLVRQVFPQYGLPFRVEAGVPPAVEAGVPLSDVPVVRAAMAMVRLQAEDYAFRAVARLLQSTYFRPEAFGATPEAARAAVRLARDAGVWTGREAYGRGFAYLRGLLKRDAAAVDDFGDAVVSPEHRAERAAEIDRAEALLGRVFADTALPTSATRRAFADALRQMIQAAGLPETARSHPEPELRARDLQALAGLETVLREVTILDTADGQAVSLTAFLDEVRRGLDEETIDPPEPADAPVVVLDARRATDPTFDHVFLVGLAEKAFPRRGRRHPFFSDAERGDLRRRGVDLADAGHDAEEEMLRFYLAATRAGRSLTLSYPSLDPAGRPQLPSHYVEEVKGLFADTGEASTVPEAEVGVRDLDLPAEAARSRRELLAATLFALWGPGANPEIDRDLAVLSALASDGPAVETALAGLAAEWERARGERFGRFDGCLDAADILDELCRRFPGASSMSARRLERFGKCPFAFLAGEVLGLAPKQEPSPDLAPMDLGLITHGVLERFFRAVGEHPDLAGRITEETCETALALLEETAEAYFGRLEGAGRVGSPALWSVQRRTILRDLRGLVAWHAENLGGWRVAETEYAFGTSDAGAPPVTVPTDHGPLRLRGRIDRIDRGPDDAGGVQIVDYKSGTSAPGQRDMRDGTSFQLPLYLMAAEALLGPAPPGRGSASPGRRPAAEDAPDTGPYTPARAFFLPVRNPGFRSTLSTKATEGHPNGTAGPARDRAAAYMRQFIEAIRRGRFPVYPRASCGRCDFAGICRYAEWQSQRKWQASPIPSLALIPESEDETGADAPGTAPHGPDEKGGA